MLLRPAYAPYLSLLINRNLHAMASQVPMSPRSAEEDVWSYPRPPALQRCPNTFKVVWTDLAGHETVLAETDQAYRILETSHPPTYYLPPDSIKLPLISSSKHTFCEWKGSASYHSIKPPGASRPIENRIWSYENPVPKYSPLKDHLCFYASTGQSREALGGEWNCFVDGEKVAAQDGDFYGGWKTKNIKGKMKGGRSLSTPLTAGPGTWGW